MKYGQEMQNIYICVQKIEYNDGSGYLFHPYLNRAIFFNDYNEMILKIEDYMGGEYDDFYCVSSELYKESVNKTGTEKILKLMLKEWKDHEWCGIIQNREKPYRFSSLLEFMSIVMKLTGIEAMDFTTV